MLVFVKSEDSDPRSVITSRSSENGLFNKASSRTEGTVAKISPH